MRGEWGKRGDRHPLVAISMNCRRLRDTLERSRLTPLMSCRRISKLVLTGEIVATTEVGLLSSSRISSLS
jgi:hypothetical protein